MAVSSSVYAQSSIDADILNHVYSGEITKAISLLEEMDHDSINLDEAVLLMQLYVGQNRYGEVIEIIEAKPELRESPESLHLSGLAYAAMGQKRAAFQAFESARMLDSVHIPSRLQLSRLYMEDKNWEKASIVQVEILDLLPENLFIKTQQARALRNLKREEEAIRLLTDVLNSNESYYKALIDLAELYYMDGNNAEGRRIIQKAIDFYPEDAQIWDMSARIAFNQKQFRRAVNHWKNAISHGNSHISTPRNVGLSYYHLHEFDSALMFFNQVLDKEPDDLQTLMYSAIIYRQREDWIRANNALDHLYFLLNDAFLTETLVQRAVAREGLKNMTGAMDDYELASKLNPENGIYYYYMATMLERNNVSLEKAVHLYEVFISFEDSADKLLIDHSKDRLQSLKERLFFRGE